MSAAHRLLNAHADRTAARVVRRSIRSLQQITDARMSGDDSGLANVWDEICVQVQGQESFFWDAYEETAGAIISAELNALPPLDRETLWLATDDGFSWLLHSEDGDDPEFTPVDIDGSISYLLREVMNRAADWSNPRIRSYLDRSF